MISFIMIILGLIVWGYICNLVVSTLDPKE